MNRFMINFSDWSQHGRINCQRDFHACSYKTLNKTVSLILMWVQSSITITCISLNYAKTYFFLKLVHICCATAFLTDCSRLDSLDWSTGRSAYGQLPTSPYSIGVLQLVATSKIEDNVSDRKHAFRKRYTRPQCPIVTKDVSYMKHIYLNCPTWLTAMQRRSRLTPIFSVRCTC